MPNLECLTQLRRVIEAAPEDRLHMHGFYEKSTCGSAYCAAGWAAVDQWFQENTTINDILPVKVLPDGSMAIGKVSYRASQRLADMFGIGYRDSRVLFAMDASTVGPHDISKAEVLNNIELLIADKEPEVYAAIEEQDEWNFDEDVDL